MKIVDEKFWADLSARRRRRKAWLTISMCDLIWKALSDDCFATERSREWYALWILGFAAGAAEGGASRIVDFFSLGNAAYHGLNKNVHNNGVRLEQVYLDWSEFVARAGGELGLFHKVAGRVIMVADETKKPRDGRKMPYCSKIHQSSGDSCKKESCVGQAIMATGFVLTDGETSKCVLNKAQFEPMLDAVAQMEGRENLSETELAAYTVCREVDRLVVLGLLEELGPVGVPVTSTEVERKHYGPAGRAAKVILVYDRAGYNERFFQTRDRCLRRGLVCPHILVRARKDAKGFRIPEKAPGRGRPRIYGEKVRFLDEFDNRKDEFEEISIDTNEGKTRRFKVFADEYVCLDGRILKVALSVDLDTGAKSIYMTTDLGLTAAEIVEAYIRRFDIEHAFKGYKDVAFSLDPYFWSKKAAELKPRDGKDARNGKLLAMDGEGRAGYVKAMEASKLAAQAGCVAAGLLQLVSLTAGGRVDPRAAGYRRSYSESGAPSQQELAAIVGQRLRKEFDLGVDSDFGRLMAKHRVEKTDSDNIVYAFEYLVENLS